MLSSISNKLTSNYLSIIKLLLSTDYVLSSISTLCCVVTQRCHLVIVGFKKKAKKESLALELSMALEKLDERADAQAEERELKRMQLEAELLEKQRDKEREHEMHMQGMMLSFMQQMMSTLTGRGYGHPSHVPTYPVHTSFSDDVPPYPPVTEHPNTSGNN